MLLASGARGPGLNSLSSPTSMPMGLQTWLADVLSVVRRERREKRSLRAGLDMVPRKKEMPVQDKKMHLPGIDPGSHPWQQCILPLGHWCSLNLPNGALKRALSAQSATASAEPESEAHCARARSIAAAAYNSRTRTDAATRAGAVFRTQPRGAGLSRLFPGTGALSAKPRRQRRRPAWNSDRCRVRARALTEWRHLPPP